MDPPGAIADLLLIPGAWHGAWCWQRVVPRLERMGFGTLVPCLPGVGERAAEPAAEIDLTAHAAAVAEIVAAHRGRPLVAVAHSYAGAALLAAGERCNGALAGRIFLDAVLLEDGETVMDLVPPDIAARRVAQVEAAGTFAMAPPAAAGFGVEREEDLALLTAHLTPQPLATYLEAIRLTTAPGAGPPSCYLSCVRPRYPPVARSACRARRYGWPVRTLETGHDAMITAPDATAALLSEVTATLLATLCPRTLDGVP